MKEILKRAFTIIVATLLATSMIIPVIGLMPGIERSHQGVAEANEHSTYIFSGGEDKYTRAWTDDNTQKWSSNEANIVNGLTTTTDGEYVFSGDSGGDVTKRRADNASQEWVTNLGGILDLAKNPNGGTIYAGTGNGNVREISASDGSTGWSYSSGASNVHSVTVGPNGDYVYGGTNSGCIFRLNAADGTEDWNTCPNSNAVHGLGVDANNDYVFTGDDGGVVRKLHTSSGSQASASTPRSYIASLEVGSNGDYFYVGDRVDEQVTKIGASDLSVVWSTTSTTDGAYSVEIDRDTGNLYADDAADIYKYNKADGSRTLAFNDHTSSVRAIATGNEYNIKSEVSGVVSDAENGTAIDNATVEAYQGGSLVKDTLTDSNGSYGLSLDDGNYTFKTSKGGYKTKEKNVTVSGATTADFALNGLYDIDGYVKENTKEGDTISDATVKVLQNGTQEYSAVTNSSGYYKINNIVGGNYTFNVSALGYQDHSSTKYVDQSKQIGFRLNNKEDEYVPYMEFKTPAWIPSNDSRPYHVYFSDENGDYKEVTEDANVTSLNVSRVKVNVSSLELEGQSGINATVNVTAEYTYKGTDYKQTNELVVAKLETAQLEILPPSHRISAFLRDTNVQMIIVAIIVGTTAAYLTSNPFAGLGGIQLALMIAWSNNRVNTGILLVGFYYMLFAGMLGMQVRKQRH